jgi:hypothetical protein
MPESHRIREAMRSGDLSTPFGSGGGAVEVDETYFGQKRDVPKVCPGQAHKFGVLALVDRESGTMRTFTFDRFRAETAHPIVPANISREARLMTDEARIYTKQRAGLRRTTTPSASRSGWGGWLSASRLRSLMST